MRCTTGGGRLLPWAAQGCGSAQCAADFTIAPFWQGPRSHCGRDLVARIVRGETGARNAHLRRLILRHLDWHDDLLVVFGASHLLALYPALKARLPKLVTG